MARFGRRATLISSVLVSLAGLLATLAGSLVVIILGLVVFTAGFFAAHAVASGWVPALAPEARAQASSLYNLFYYVGSSLLGWLIGLPFIAYGWPALVLFVVGLQVIAMLAASFLSPAGTKAA